MEDKGTCPFCNKEFKVTPDMYGFHVNCPLCGEEIDILAEPEHYIETPFGAMGIGSVTKET